MTAYKLNAIAMALVLTTLAGCGGSSAETATDTPGSTGTASAQEGDTVQANSAGEVNCHQLGLANYTPTYSSCTDGNLRSMFCKQSGRGYVCECQVGPMLGEMEVLDTVTIEEGKPFVRPDDIQDIRTAHVNATAAANELCGFAITHPCDGTS